MNKTNDKKILTIIAPKDFRDEEYLIPKKILEDNNIKVVNASIKAGNCKGSLGAKARAEISINNVNDKDYDGVMFVGGSGARIYIDNKRAHEVAVNMYSDGKIISAICIAPAILAKSGILKGKKATIFPAHANYLDEGGANYTKSDVEVDENIITADGPKSAGKFAKIIVDKLAKEK